MEKSAVIFYLIKRKRAKQISVYEKLPPPQAPCFSHRGKHKTRVTHKWLVMKHKGPWKGENWEAKFCLFSPSSPFLHAKFSSRDKRLGTRQYIKYVCAILSLVLTLLLLITKLIPLHWCFGAQRDECKDVAYTCSLSTPTLHLPYTKNKTCSAEEVLFYS